MPRQRDYRAEYQRRLASGLASGRSTSESRGHGGPKRFDRLLQTVGREVARGKYRSATDAAREQHVPVEKLRNYMRTHNLAEKRGGRLVPLRPKDTYHVPVISGGGVHEIDVDIHNAELAGQYMGAVRKFIRTGDESDLAEFVDKAVVDVNGQNYPLETDLLALTDAYRYEDISWDEIYRRNG